MTQAPPDEPFSKTYEEDPLRKVARLERLLRDHRTFSRKVTVQLHRRLSREVQLTRKRARQAEQRAADAERRAVQAERRAERLQAELDSVRHSTTWKAGRAVLAVPTRIKRMGSR